MFQGGATWNKCILTLYKVCVQYLGECSVPWGISWVPWGISWVPWGCSVPWGDIMSTVGGYLKYCVGYSVPWGISWCMWVDIMSTVGVFSTVEDTILWNFSTVGGYYDTCGGWVLWGCSVSWGTQITKDFPPRYWRPPQYSWYPPRYWVSPTVLKITPTVLMISPKVLKISPHIYHDIPTVLKISPRGTQDIPPWYSRYPPMVLMISPTVLNTPHDTDHPHGTAHTLYRVILTIWFNFIQLPDLDTYYLSFSHHIFEVLVKIQAQIRLFW